MGDMGVWELAASDESHAVLLIAAALVIAAFANWFRVTFVFPRLLPRLFRRVFGRKPQFYSVAWWQAYLKWASGRGRNPEDPVLDPEDPLLDPEDPLLESLMEILARVKAHKVESHVEATHLPVSSGKSFLPEYDYDLVIAVLSLSGGMGLLRDRWGLHLLSDKDFQTLLELGDKKEIAIRIKGSVFIRRGKQLPDKSWLSVAETIMHEQLPAEKAHCIYQSLKVLHATGFAVTLKTTSHGQIALLLREHTPRTARSAWGLTPR